MSCCFQIQKIKLPKQFLFDSLRLHAQFQSASVELLNLAFDIGKSLHERKVHVGIKLKVPSIRTKFTLVLQIKIINMRIRPTMILVDLSNNLKECQYVFTTSMGRVSAFAHVIQHHSLPRQLQVSASEQSAVMSMSETSYNKGQNNNLNKQTTSKQIRTNDEEQQEKPNHVPTFQLL